MQGDQITFGDAANEFDRLFRIFPLHPFKVVDEAIQAIRYVRVVLDLLVTNVQFYCFAGIPFVGHAVKGGGVLLVLVKVHFGVFSVGKIARQP